MISTVVESCGEYMCIAGLRRLVNSMGIVACLAFCPLVVANETPSKPLKVASMNLCADQFILLLAKPANIVSLSSLAADRQFSYLWRQVGDIPLNNGAVEDLLPLAPNLIVAGEYDDKYRISMLRAFGFKVIILPMVNTLDEVYSTLLALSRQIGEPLRGEAIVHQLQVRVAEALEKKIKVPPGQKKVAVIYSANGFTHGRNTLQDALLQLAGFRNGAASAGLQGHGTLSLEQLIALQPDLLIIQNSVENQHSNAQRLLQHPALVRGLVHTKRVNMPGNLWVCGGPASIAVLDQLIDFQRALYGKWEGHHAGR